MLWDIIRDFFVQYIFGGTASNYNTYTGFIGVGITNSGTQLGIDAHTGIPITLKALNGQDISYIALGDWLSTTLTIITMFAICFFLFLLIRWLFRLTAGLIQGRG